MRVRPLPCMRATRSDTAEPGWRVRARTSRAVSASSRGVDSRPEITPRTAWRAELAATLAAMPAPETVPSATSSSSGRSGSWNTSKKSPPPSAGP